LALEGGWRVATAKDFLANFGKAPYIISIVKIYDPPQGKKEILAMLTDAQQRIASHIDALRRETKS